MEIKGKPQCVILRKAIEDALVSVAATHGVEIKTASGSYDPGNWFKVQVVCSSIGSDGEVFDQMADDYTNYAAMFNCDPKWLHQTTPCGTYKIVGCKPKSSKYPIIVEYADRPGKRFKVGAEAVARKFNPPSAQVVNIRGAK